jgi:type I restriction enzyme M protein
VSSEQQLFENGTGANLGFEEKLWAAADKMRSYMDPSEYKHVVLGLIFLKYVSDAFEEKRRQLELATADPSSEWYVEEPEDRHIVTEDRDEYLAENIFWVPSVARWNHLQANAKQAEIPSLKGVLPTEYSRPSLDKKRLGELIDLISTIGFEDENSRSSDPLGRVYEYFLGRFASAEGKGGGEFYTPRSIVALLVEYLRRSLIRHLLHTPSAINLLSGSLPAPSDDQTLCPCLDPIAHFPRMPIPPR